MIAAAGSRADLVRDNGRPQPGHMHAKVRVTTRLPGPVQVITLKRAFARVSKDGGVGAVEMC
jgi:hypothetical protein